MLPEGLGKLKNSFTSSRPEPETCRLVTTTNILENGDEASKSVSLVLLIMRTGYATTPARGCAVAQAARVPYQATLGHLFFYCSGFPCQFSFHRLIHTHPGLVYRSNSGCNTEFVL
jgi:hypothetical protein